MLEASIHNFQTDNYVSITCRRRTKTNARSLFILNRELNSGKSIMTCRNAMMSTNAGSAGSFEYWKYARFTPDVLGRFRNRWSFAANSIGGNIQNSLSFIH